MSNAAIVADTLRAWREAERLLDALPPGSPDHETARLLIAELRSVYVDLTERADADDVRLRTSESVIERAKSKLANLEAALGMRPDLSVRDGAPLGGGATGD